MSTMKELRSLLNTATDQGWEVTRGRNNHIKCVSPNGNVVFVSSTPSDHRALENIKRDLRVNGLVIVRKNRRR